MVAQSTTEISRMSNAPVAQATCDQCDWSQVTYNANFYDLVEQRLREHLAEYGHDSGQIETHDSGQIKTRRGRSGVLIDERTRLRIVIAVWACFMVGVLGIKNWVLGALIVGAVVAVATVLWRRWTALCVAEEAARQAVLDAQARQRQQVLDRMQAQHQQAVTGDERGIYGEGYAAHAAYREATRPRMPGDDKSPPAEAEGMT
jgi:hypothetical protein